jgi:hypothetical protein
MQDITGSGARCAPSHRAPAAIAYSRTRSAVTSIFSCRDEPGRSSVPIVITLPSAELNAHWDSSTGPARPRPALGYLLTFPAHLFNRARNQLVRALKSCIFRPPGILKPFIHAPGY